MIAQKIIDCYKNLVYSLILKNIVQLAIYNTATFFNAHILFATTLPIDDTVRMRIQTMEEIERNRVQITEQRETSPSYRYFRDDDFKNLENIINAYSSYRDFHLRNAQNDQLMLNMGSKALEAYIATRGGGRATTKAGQIGKIVGKSIGEGLISIGDNVLESTKEEMSNLLNYGLKKWISHNSEEELRKLLSDQDKKNTFSRIFGSDEILNLKSRLNLNEVEYQTYSENLFKLYANKIVLSQLTNELQDKSISDIYKTTRELDEKIDHSAKNIQKLYQFNKEYSENILSLFSEMNKQTKDVLDLVAKNIDQNKVNGKKIDAIQRALFFDMSLESKKNALQNEGWMSNDREFAETFVKIEEDHKNKINGINKFKASMQGLSITANILPLPESTKTMVTAANIMVQGGLGFAISGASQNYFEATCIFGGMLSGLMGLNSSDDRQAQIMKELKGISDRLDRLNDSIVTLNDNLIKGFKTLLDTQIIIFDKLIDIERKINFILVQLETNEKNRDFSASTIIGQLRDIFQDKISSCEKFIERNNKSRRLIETINNYDDLNDLFVRLGDLFVPCVEILENVTRNPTPPINAFHSILMAKSFKDKDNHMDLFVRFQYYPAVDYYKNSLNQELNNFYLSELLLSESVRNIANLVIELHPFLKVFDFHTKSLISKDNFLNPSRKDNDRGYFLLQQTLKIVDSSISQQIIFSGEPILDNLLLDISNSMDSNKAQKAFDVIKYNPIMQRNLVLKILKTIFHSKNLSDFYYQKIISTHSNSNLFDNLVDRKWEFVFKKDEKVSPIDSNWFIIIKNPMDHALQLEIPLPSSIRFKENKFLYHSDLNHLFVLKENIIDELMKYTFVESLSLDDQKLFINYFAK